MAMSADTERLDAQAIDIYYRELARLADRTEELTRSAFEDIKLLGGIGALLSLKPLLGLFSVDSIPNPQLYLLLGFLLIALALGVIGYTALMKQSVILFYLQEIQRYESAIRSLLGQQTSQTFRVAEMWHFWAEKTQRRLGGLFYFHFYLIVVCFPTIVLLYSDPVQGGALPNIYSFLYAGIYCAISVAVCITHYHATTKIVYTPENQRSPADLDSIGNRQAEQVIREGRS